jgi:hypothetical protein
LAARALARADRFLQLIIDPSCSIVFESEQIDPRVMDQPPRGLAEPMFGRRVLTIAGLQGLSVLAAVLGVYLWSVLGDLLMTSSGRSRSRHSSWGTLR